MISAAEALRLPSAQLTSEERATADALEADIEAHVRLKMERRGCEFTTNETRSNVIAELNQRLKAAGFQPQWQAIIEPPRIGLGTPTHVGFKLALAPSDDAYRAAVSLAMA